MSVFANGNTNHRVNALLDPFATISYTGLLSEQYFEIIKRIFGEFMYPGMVSIKVNYNGNEENIIMPGKIRVSNKIANFIEICQQMPFPFTFVSFISTERQHWFSFGNDIMQFVGSKDVYVLSSYRNGITSFSIVLINNDCVYVVNINSNDNEIQYFELDMETKRRMQKYISNPVAFELDFTYEDLLDIFENANVIRAHKEKIEDISFEGLVKKVIDKCISSPSQITSKLSRGELTSEPLTMKYNTKLPELKVETKPNIMHSNSIQTSNLIERMDWNLCRYRVSLNDYEEFFAFILPKVTCKTDDFLWWYAKIEKNKAGYGNYQVSYYYYDAETVTALECACAHHRDSMCFLRLNDALDAGIIPCYITTRWFETLDEAQIEVEAYYNNPETIKSTKGYEMALVRSINKIGEYKQHKRRLY